jgi:Mpv17 / PMP22 family
MVASAFAKTYMSLLKTYPLVTNLATGCVLMTAGDGVAQVMELSSSSSSSSLSSGGGGGGGERYSILDDVHHQNHDHHNHQEQPHCESLHDEPHALSTSAATKILNTHEIFESIRDRLFGLTGRQSWNQLIAVHAADNNNNGRATIFDHSMVSWWDPFRTGTMACWSFFYAPFYVTVYKMFDLYLPRGPKGVVARVALSFASSIPVNAAFYTYGTAAHHTHDWWQRQQQQDVSSVREMNVDNKKNMMMDALFLSSSYQYDELRDKVLAKLEAEMPTTITRSASCWVPANLIIFSVVPSHLQPLALMSCAVFWNCYLSLTQHRDIPEDVLQHHQLCHNHQPSQN